jgi:hypothetical protein
MRRDLPVLTFPDNNNNNNTLHLHNALEQQYIEQKQIGSRKLADCTETLSKFIEAELGVRNARAASDTLNK